MQLFDVGGCVRERVLERGRAVDARAVEPAAELALLPPRDRGDPHGVVRMPLHERERLQDGIVDARRDLGSLGSADALCPLRRQLPDPRAKQEEEGARDRTRREERTGRADVAEHDHGADHRQRDRDDRQRAAGTQRAAAPE